MRNLVVPCDGGDGGVITCLRTRSSGSQKSNDNPMGEGYTGSLMWMLLGSPARGIAGYSGVGPIPDQCEKCPDMLATGTLGPPSNGKYDSTSP